MANVTEMPPVETAEEQIPPPETDANQATQPSQSASPVKPKGRPPKSQGKPDGRQPVFFDRVAQVPKEDWGTRAFMYVYVDEPVCNPKTFGDTRYVLKAKKPILDLDFLKEQYGSFKGWMSLNLRKTGKDQTDEVDRLEFEIFDPLAPPKIPRGTWANDPRNRRWEALMPPEPPPQSAVAESLREGMRIYKDIKEEVKEEMAPDTPQSDRARETLETMKIAKDLFAPTATGQPATPVDPFDTAKKIMEMRQNDPVTAVLLARMDALDKQLADSRAREFALQEKILERANGKGGSIVDQLLELAGSAEKLDGVKKLFGLFGGGSDTVVRAGRTTVYDVVRDIANSPFGSNLGSGLGTLLSQIAANGGSAQQPAFQLNGTQPNTAEANDQKIRRIAQTITNPMINEYFDKGESGELFAEHVFNFWPQDFLFLKSIGSGNIANLYRDNMKDLWAHIQPKEHEFRKFLQDFCAWNPEAEAAPESAAPAADAVIDLEAEAN